jgi:hypothetical protein
MERAGSRVRTTDHDGTQRLWYVGEGNPLRATALVQAAMPDTVKQEWISELREADLDRLSLIPDEIREIKAKVASD